jgi:Xaa-Pro aminopeptidase
MNKPGFRHSNRVAALRSLIREQEIDAMLISDPYNRRYLSGFIGTAGYLLVTESDAVLATDSRYTEQAEEQAAGFDISNIQGRLSEWFPKLLSDLDVKKVGFEADNLTVSSFTMFKEAVSESGGEITFEPKTGVTSTARAIKDATEIKLLQKAIDIGDAAFEETAAKLISGMTEKEAAWEFEKAIRARGAECLSFDTIVATGPNAARPHHQTGDTPLKEGETIVFDCGATYQGYCSDLTRTVVLGEADAEVERIYNIVLEAQETAIEKVEAGITGSEADAIARNIIDDAGYADNFGHSLGHGLGLEVHEEPNVGPRGATSLQEGMPFTIEPGIYIPGWGGVRIEDVVVLENGKARVLSHAAKMQF